MMVENDMAGTSSSGTLVGIQRGNLSVFSNIIGGDFISSQVAGDQVLIWCKISIVDMGRGLVGVWSLTLMAS